MNSMFQHPLMSHAGLTSEPPAVRHAPHSPHSRRRIVIVGLLASGAALRLWQYAADTSFWVDEITLAHNIVGRPLRRLLFEPLAFDQIAPKGFLLVQKLAALGLGPSELALRLSRSCAAWRHSSSSGN
jgi:hypothetical protein